MAIHKGRKQTPEHLASRVESYKSKRHKRSEEFKERLYKPVYQLDKAGNFVKRYPSLSHAEAETSINRNAISHVLNGRSKTAGGFYWIYERLTLDND